jgi:3-methyladenine DNA glycosylase/8-oxoguanine DNA glycosylase
MTWMRSGNARSTLRTDVASGRVRVKSRDALAASVAHMFRLDEDLSGFYAVVSADGDLSCEMGASIRCSASRFARQHHFSED